MDAAQPLEVLPDKWAHGVKIFSRPTGLASWGAAGSGASPSARPERPADGIPLAVRELFDMAGLVTTYGSIKFAEHVPEHTAAAVTRLEAAGYAAVGKTNLHQFAYGISSRTPHFGTGAKSGRAAPGTDSGVSIRIPGARCCGVVGFKPSHGLVPLDGCFPLAPSLDHVGPTARSERVGSVFMREVAEVHSDLFRAHATRNGANVRVRIERCLAVTDEELEGATRPGGPAWASIA